MKFFGRARRIVSSAMQDNITGEAAKAAYYFFLSLFPMVIALFAFTGIFGGSAAFDRIMAWLNTALPDDATAFLEGFVREITDERRPDALSLGIILAIWSASNFFAALGDGLDTMFDVRGRSSWLKKRLKSLLLMVVGGAVLFTGAVAIVAGPHIAAALGISNAVQLLTWPLVFVLLVGLLWLTYYILPAHDQSSMRKELLIGAVAGTTVWLAATAVFRFYVGNFANYGRMYGILGGIVILMLWLYLTALAILLGGEVADVLVNEREEAGADAGDATA
ncbi:MAG TPA: YihY/virulence factor BrkB family protein [Longimicrobiales bacterium]|nr:YihY/virulence factor BrkB family protein [Longimicrobiales bacterium]